MRVLLEMGERGQEGGQHGPLQVGVQGLQLESWREKIQMHPLQIQIPEEHWIQQGLPLQGEEQEGKEQEELWLEELEG